MQILSRTEYSIKIHSRGWIYEITDLNPYQIKKVLNYKKKGFIGRAWNLLRKYPFTKESTSDYLNRCMRNVVAGGWSTIC